MLDEAEEILGSVPAEACRQAIDEAQLLMIEADREIVVRTIGRAETACTTGGCLDDLADAIALFEIADDWRIGGDLVHAINKYGDAWEAANRAILGATKNLDNAPAGVEGTGTLDGATATSLEALGLPGDYVLAPNFPNPFNPSTSIRVGLPEASRVTLNVYDALGREVARLADGHLGAGFHEFRFEAGSLPSGVYIYRLATPAKALTGRMTLLK